MPPELGKTAEAGARRLAMAAGAHEGAGDMLTSMAPGATGYMSDKYIKKVQDRPKGEIHTRAPEMHDGGKVPKDGVYALEKGEKVIPKEKNMAEETKKRKHAGHGYKHTHITHHDDGSHTTHHDHEDGKSHKDYASADHDGMLDGLMDHTSMPNPGEQEAEAGPQGAAPAAV